MATKDIWVIENYEYRRCDKPWREFRMPVSIHGHTYHSEESVARMNYVMAKPILRNIQDWMERRFMEKAREEFNYKDFFYRPPISPLEVWELELNGVKDLGFNDLLIALTDHDKIDACFEFQRLRPDLKEKTTFSEEFSLFIDDQIIHMGIHGIPEHEAQDLHQKLQKLAQEMRHDDIFDLLHSKDLLVIFNHPLWEFRGFGDFDSVLKKFLKRYRWAIHAFEFNGLRSRHENERVIDLARRYQMPLIGGGDRHVPVPSVVLAGTREATTFEEFMQEVKDGYASVICKPAYFIPLSWKLFVRILQYVRAYRNIAYYKNRPITSYPIPQRMLTDYIATAANGISNALEKMGWLR
jgi:hypothetical protein